MLSPTRVPAGVIVLLVLASGCASLTAGLGDRHAPDPLGAIPAAECPRQARQPADWTWRADLQRTGYLPCEHVPDAVQLAYTVPAINTGDHTAAKASPVALEDGWLVPGDTGNLTRFDERGRIVWTRATRPSGFGIHGTPAIHDGTAYIGAYDGALYAFDLATGELRWRTQLGGSIGASPLVHDGQVYIAVETPDPDGYVSIVDAATGEEVWRSGKPTDHPHSSVAIAPEAGLFLVGSNDGNLYAWDLTTRDLLWTFETGDAIKGPILVHDGAAFLGSWDDRVYRVDLATGEQDWAYETGDNVMNGPAVDPRTGTLYVGSFDDNVYALAAEDGHLRWRTGLGGSILSSPVLADDRLLVGAYDEHLYALDATDGSIVWSYEARGRVTSSAAVHDGRIAFTERADEEGGRLYVLEGAG